MTTTSKQVQVSKHRDIAIFVDFEGTFIAEVGRRVLRSLTLKGLTGDIDAEIEARAGEQRKDVAIRVRLLRDRKIVEGTYVGLRANKGHPKHAIKVDGEKDILHPEDYYSGLLVLPASTPPAAVVEYQVAEQAVRDAQRRLSAAETNLGGRRLPWESNWRSSTTNTGCIVEQARFAATLTKIIALPVSTEVRS